MVECECVLGWVASWEWQTPSINTLGTGINGTPHQNQRILPSQVCLIATDVTVIRDELSRRVGELLQ